MIKSSNNNKILHNVNIIEKENKNNINNNNTNKIIKTNLLQQHNHPIQVDPTSSHVALYDVLNCHKLVEKKRSSLDDGYK